MTPRTAKVKAPFWIAAANRQADVVKVLAHEPNVNVGLTCRTTGWSFLDDPEKNLINVYNNPFHIAECYPYQFYLPKKKCWHKKISPRYASSQPICNGKEKEKISTIFRLIFTLPSSHPDV